MTPPPTAPVTPRRLPRRLLWTIAAVDLVAAVVVLAPFVGDPERYARPDDAPGFAAGNTVALPRGRTWYAEAGSGATVVLVHGVTGNHSVWDHVQGHLGAGLRTVAIDLYGRGYSDRPDGTYDNAFFTAQLLEFGDALGLARFALVGSSMGGAVVLDFAARHPERVAAVVLVGAAGLPFATPALRDLLLLPGVGSYAMRSGGMTLFEATYPRMVADPKTITEQFRARYGMSARIGGFRGALLQTMRHFDFHGLEPQARQLAAQRTPVLVVWGENDRIAPVANYHRFRELIPQARGLLIGGAGHLPHFEKPAVFNPTVGAFLRDAFATP